VPLFLKEAKETPGIENEKKNENQKPLRFRDNDARMIKLNYFSLMT